MTTPRWTHREVPTRRCATALIVSLLVLAPVALLAASSPAEATHTIQCKEEGFLYWENDVYVSDGEYRNLASFDVSEDCGLSLTVTYHYEVGESKVTVRGVTPPVIGVSSFLEDPGTTLTTNTGHEDPVKVQTYLLDVKSTGFHLMEIKVKAYTVK